jgi:acyl-CoA thioesterase FadM
MITEQPAAQAAVEENVQPLEWLVVRQDVSYLKQLSDRAEPYAVRTASTKIGNTSLQFTAEVIDPLNDDAVHARAGTVVVSAINGKPVPVPGRIRDSLAAMSL